MDRSSGHAMNKIQYVCASMSINGSINFNQFFEILRAIEINATKSEASWLFKYLDKDGSNKVS